MKSFPVPPQPLNYSALFQSISEEQAVFKPACTQQPLVIKEVTTDHVSNSNFSKEPDDKISFSEGKTPGRQHL